MKKVSDHSPWEKDLKTSCVYPKLNEDIECEVLIVGGGITGALSAYYCMKNMIDAIVVDEGLISHQSTLGSTSILHYEIDTDLIRLRSFIGDEESTEVFKMCLQSVYDLEDIVKQLDDDCEFVRRPSFYYTNRAENYKYIFDECKARKESGFNVEFFDGKKDKDKYSFDYCGGIFSYNSGAEINPVKFTYEALKYCNKNGIKVYENTKISDFNLDEVVVKTSDGYSIKCKKIIMAMGYDNLQFFENPFWTITRTFGLTTLPVKNFKGWYQRSLIKDDDVPYTYIRTTKDNRIIIGGEDIEVTEYDKDKLDMANDHPLAMQKYHILEKRLFDMFPQIEDKVISSYFNGIFVDTDDGLPFIGEHPDYPNVYFNMAVGSNGVLYGLLGGKLIISNYLNNDDKIKIFSFDRVI